MDPCNTLKDPILGLAQILTADNPLKIMENVLYFMLKKYNQLKK